jgi:hypothetical protein
VQESERFSQWSLTKGLHPPFWSNYAGSLSQEPRAISCVLKFKTVDKTREATSMRWRLWTRFKLALRKRPLANPRLPFELDEFAALLSSRDPAALKRLAVGLSRSSQARSRRLQV